MARQNVGSPKFYIDYIQYWNAKGVLAGIGPYAEHSTSDHSNGIDEWRLTDIGGSAYYPELIGFDPYNYINIQRNPNAGDNGSLYSYYFMSFSERVFLPDSGKIFISYLNHNFSNHNVVPLSHNSVSVYKTMTHNINIGDGIVDPLGSGSGNWDGYNIMASSQPLTEVCNMDGYGGNIKYNGFSIMENNAQSAVQSANAFNPDFADGTADGSSWSNGTPYGAGFDVIIPRLHYDTEYNNTDYNEDGNPSIQHILGSLNIGGVYEMPNSPDLSLTMTREYDGVSTQTTIGGNTISNINYSGPTNWRPDLPAWGLTKDKFNLTKPKKSSSRGRRVWDLSFSYISNEDLFAVNESMSNANPTNSNIDTEASGYSSSDFEDVTYDDEGNLIDDEGRFKTNIESDSSFFGMVIHKTMGGALPFMFQPDSNNNSPDQFAICMIDQDSISFEQVAYNVYNVKLKIREVW